jgi:phosphopantetheine adenylyltransferase
MKAIKEFLQDVDPEIDYDIVEIRDMYGPTRTDPTYQVNILIHALLNPVL